MPVTKLLSILLISSICLTQEMEVDGDLKVTGTVESTTIDSLKAVIADLQAQLAALQVANKMETRIFTIENLEGAYYNIDFNELTGSNIQSALITTLNITINEIVDDFNNGGIYVRLVMDNGKLNNTIDVKQMTLHKFNPDGSISYHYHYTQYDDNNGGQREVYDPLFAWNGQEFEIQTPWTHNINITFAITAQFPN